MTNKLIGVALFAALFMLAPLAAAEADSGNETGTSSTRPDDAAWVDDCPPDMMCAASADDTGSKENVTRDPDCEYCRDHQGEDCVDCVGAPGEEDDTTWGTDCPPEVLCMVNGETDDPDDAGWVDCGGEVCAYDDGPETNSDGDDTESAEASALGAVVLLAAVGLTLGAFALSLRRHGS